MLVPLALAKEENLQISMLLNLGLTLRPSPSDETPPLVALDVPSTSAAPSDPAATSNSRIANAITTLFAHMNVIHSDLVERIEHVHEHVDLIVERQAHDIVTLSHRHTEFIIKVNDFINSF